MAHFGHGSYGFSLKALLEDPNLQNPPNLQNGITDLKKPGKHGGRSIMPNHNAAYMGPNLWEKPGSTGGVDFDLEYMDLDEFLSENGVPVNLDENDDAQAMSLLATALTSSPPRSPNSQCSPGLPISPLSPNHSNLMPQQQHQDSEKHDSSRNSLGVYIPDSPIRPQKLSPQNLSPLIPCMSPLSTPVRSPEPSAIEKLYMQSEPNVRLNYPDSPPQSMCSPPTAQSPQGWSDVIPGNDSLHEEDLPLIQNTLPGQDNFDPTCRKFSEEELKPQPLIKKSKKIFVKDSSKDDKYWHRRQKNNVAAKRSRDARRVKENQIAMRASFLEQQNDSLSDQVQQLKRENDELIKRLAKYEKV